jgi:hypothetical protein
MSSVNDPPSKTAGESNYGLAADARAISFVKDFGPWFYAGAVPTLYFLGFLVLNSHLAKRGILDAEFIAARYFLAGVVFFFYLLCFYLFAGRASILTPRWLDEEYEGTKRDITKPPWSHVVWIQSYVSVFYSCYLSSVLFILIAIGNSGSVLYVAVLSIAFLIGTPNLGLTLLQAYVLICARVAAILAFFILAALEFYRGDGFMFMVFGTYFLMFVLIYQLVKAFTKSKVIDDNMVFVGLCTVVILITIAIGFGALFYGKVAPNLGGARPQIVSISLSDEARIALPAPIAPPEGQLLEGMLIHQTASHIYIESSGRTVRLRTAGVVALVIDPEPPWLFLKVLKEFNEPRRSGPFDQKRDIPRPP